MESEIHFKLPQGEIRGARRRSIYGDDYFSFEGIPYGRPPLGDLRFKAPQPAEPWSGELDCTKCASKPVQKNIMTGQLEGTEDCLYLNVYVRKLKYINRLPVMVYIYGGGFYMGEATQDLYSPDYFMREDVILVTLNYRLCALGFLSLQDPSLEVPGNAALKDQVLSTKG
ncbi:esterase B1-like [Teleopsis dalmanni]|uniref:esterase B1-like n=1 Tax=Teleopsis dalmanni TaxID=139649 RepID=UPI0018CE45D3|nr:esterase B1-like [Teleopsis dalmanni]